MRLQAQVRRNPFEMTTHQNYKSEEVANTNTSMNSAFTTKSTLLNDYYPQQAPSSIHLTFTFSKQLSLLPSQQKTASTGKTQQSLLTSFSMVKRGVSNGEKSIYELTLEKMTQKQVEEERNRRDEMNSKRNEDASYSPSNFTLCHRC